MCMIADDEWWDWYDEKHVRSRKPFNCGECRRQVPKGETYALQGGLHERRWQWNKTCAQCDAASAWLEIVCDGWIFNRRLEDLLSHVVGEEKELRSAPLTRLTRWMNAGWQKRDGEVRSVDEVHALTSKAVAAYKAKYRRALAA